MFQMTRHLDSFCFEFFSEECEKFISPHFLEGIMVNVFSFHPGVMREREASDGGGEMDMEISFKVPAKGMDSEIDARDQSLLICQLFDNACSDRRGFVHEMTVDPE